MILRRLINTLIVSMAAAIGGYTVWILSWSYKPDTEEAISSGLLIALSLGATLLGAAIAANKSHPAPVRRAWLLIGLAALSNAVAEALWYYFAIILGIAPFPSTADLFYLLFYPLMLTGVLCLPFIPIERERRILVGLDMTIIMLVGALFLWYFILAPMQVGGEGTWADAVALAYPIADLFILAGLLSFIQRELDNFDRTVLIFLSASMLFTCVADIFFAVIETYSIPYQTPPLNILWMISSWAMLVAAAWQILFQPARSHTGETFTPLLRHSLLYIAPLLGMGLAFLSAAALFGLDLRLYGALVGSLILAALVLLRQHVVLRDNNRLYKRMEQLAVTDALTGVYNRHYFNGAIHREIKRAERYHRGLALLMIDVDNFKAYNDTHGHLRGDTLLKSIAGLLATRIRSSDFLARYGGDEFVVVLPETDIEEAKAVADKTKEAFASRFVKQHLSVSIGIAVFQHGMTAEALLAEADRDLYLGKPVRS